MKPAGSIVFFTTASGAGYGMLFWLGVLHAAGALPGAAWYGVTALAIGLVLVTAGLLSSVAHLGNPQRAWRALSQWRSSWLSREGVAAVLVYVPAVGLGAVWLMGGAVSAGVGLVMAGLAAGTVYCTAMIYASLKPVRQWRDGYVVPFYLLAAVFSGAVCLAAVTGFASTAAAGVLGWIGIVSGLAAGAMKIAYWQRIDSATGASTVASATGLGHLGVVRSFEAPHSEENYLLKEMGFRIARKHAGRLRVYAVMIGFAVPVAVLVGVVLGVMPVAGLMVAAVCAVVGMAVERWLFFAEATHTVVLYYGRAA